jgi:two-component system, OmpR family, response regulator RegX3
MTNPDATVLLVEDEDSFVEALTVGLRREGFRVQVAHDGSEALEQFDAVKPDLVLLDVMLPKVSGVDVCRELRRRSSVPIIMVTAKGSEIDTVVGLEVGADDYVVKPFGLRELIARIRAVSRRARPRTNGEPDEAFAIGPLRVDPRAHRATLSERELPLTAKEFALLELLARDPGAVVSRERILAEVWNTTWYGSAKTIDVHVASLRRKLGDPGWIETVRGVGLRLRASP